MRKLADCTKIAPIKRYDLSHSLIRELNALKGDLSIQKSVEVDGYTLPPPIFLTATEQRSDNGILNIKSKLREPMRLKQKNWIFAYSNLSNTQEEDEEADDLLKGFKEAQGLFGIVIEEPVFVVVEKDHVEEWKSGLKKESKDHVVVVLFFTNRESRYYAELKRFLVNELKVPSQALLRKTVQGKGALSVFSKVICQINAKLGKALWTLPPQHPFWKDRSLICGGLSLSKGSSGHTLGFVGTFSQDMAKTYANSRSRLPPRQEIPEQVY